MTNFIFCLIFIQVSIFFIAGILLVATFLYSMKNQEDETDTVQVRTSHRKIKSFSFRPNMEN